MRATDSISKSVLSNICDPLVELGPEMDLTAALARSWSNPDGREWLFRLRAGVKFQDGRTLGANDVRASIERTRSDPDSLLADRLSTIRSVEVAGPLEVRIRTRESDPLLLYRLSDVFITPEGSGVPGGRPIGTGPFAFESMSAGVLRLKAFDGCWRGRPRIRNVEFVAMKSDEERLRAIRTGSVDLLRWAPSGWARRQSSEDQMRLVSRRGIRVLFLWMNSTSQRGVPNPFADARVRRAVSLAIDRDALVARLAGRASPMNQLVPPSIAGFVPELGRIPFDPDKARLLLRQAGYPAGFETTLTSVPVGVLGESLDQMLRAAGIRLQRREVGWPGMLRDWRASRLPLFLGGWSFSIGDSAFFYDECIRSREPGATSAWNPGYSDPEIDFLISEILRTAEGAAREEQFARLANRLRVEMPLVPLFAWHDLYAVRSGVHFHPRLDGALRAFEATLD